MKKVLASAALVAALATPACAGSGLAPGCFTRDYDKAHLAKHPDQLVTSMRLLVTDDDRFALRVTLRGSDDALQTQGWCSQKSYGLLCDAWPPLPCSTFCKPSVGGYVTVSARGRGTAMLHLDDRIQMLTANRESEWWLRHGKDDNVFRLDRVDARACKEGEH